MRELKPCPAEHELKCWPEYYDAVERGDKPFEIRKWDRPYQVGDTLLLRRYDPRVQDYTGQQMRKKITYLLDLTYLPGDNIPHFTGYVAIGLAQPANEPLTLEQLRQMDGEPVYSPQCGWGIIGFRKVGTGEQRHSKKYTVGFNYGWEWLDDVLRIGPLYARKSEGRENNA